MIKESMATDDVAAHEFDMEHGVLSRLNHTNITTIVGAGHQPRRFIAVEYLAGAFSIVHLTNAELLLPCVHKHRRFTAVIIDGQP
jgi:hypothetical protein